MFLEKLKEMYLNGRAPTHLSLSEKVRRGFQLSVHYFISHLLSDVHLYLGWNGRVDETVDYGDGLLLDERTVRMQVAQVLGER